MIEEIKNKGKEGEKGGDKGGDELVEEFRKPNKSEGMKLGVCELNVEERATQKSGYCCCK